MKTLKFSLLALCLLSSTFLISQTTNLQQPTSVNTDGAVPDASAILDVQSNDRGMLVPRMTTAQRGAIGSPATGLLVFDTDTGSFWFFDSGTWYDLSAPLRLSDADLDTKIQVEENSDEDHIRFDAAGFERLVISADSSVITGKMKVEAGPVLFSGILGSTPTSGPGTRLMWVPDKAAFRSGSVNSDQWDAPNIGVASFIGGGAGNKAKSHYTFIGGGTTNMALEDGAFVGGSFNSTASGVYSFVGGGSLNEATNTHAFTGGGSQNTASGIGVFIGGGNDNMASGNRSFIGGGQNNTTSGLHSFIGAGTDNFATNSGSFVGGGVFNSATGLFAAICGGEEHIASGEDSFVGGGNENTASGINSFCGGGLLNTASGSNAFIGGGRGLRARPYAETALGTYNTLYTPLGTDSINVNDRLFGIGNGPSSSNRSDALVLLKNGNTGIGMSSPNEKMEIKGNLLVRNEANNGALIFSPSTHGYSEDPELVIQSAEGTNGWNSNFHISRNAIFRTSDDTYQYIGDFANPASKMEFLSNGDIAFYFAPASTGTVSFTERVRIQASSGNLGIGRTASTNPLEVEGNASKTSAGDWLANSDARLKTNIRPLDSEAILQKMLALRGITYEWSDDQTGSERPTGIQYGFTAQNIQSVFPELVSEDNLGFLQTAYGTYDAMTVEALRALYQEIENGKLRMENLERENDELKSQLSEMDELKQRMAQLEAALLGTAEETGEE